MIGVIFLRHELRIIVAVHFGRSAHCTEMPKYRIKCQSSGNSALKILVF